MMNSTSVSSHNNVVANNSTFNHKSYENYENGYNGYNHHHQASTMDMTIASSEMADSPPRLIDASSASNHHHHTIITAEADLSQLSLEIEKERAEYQEKSKHLQQQLDAFRNEIDDFMVDDMMTTMDRIHRDQQDQGNTKYSTIQKIKRGSTHSRVEIFEEL